MHSEGDAEAIKAEASESDRRGAMPIQHWRLEKRGQIAAIIGSLLITILGVPLFGAVAFFLPVWFEDYNALAGTPLTHGEFARLMFGLLEQWMEKAEGDYKAALHFYRRKKHQFAAGICFHCSESAQKYLIAYAVR